MGFISGHSIGSRRARPIVGLLGLLIALISSDASIATASAPILRFESFYNSPGNGWDRPQAMSIAPDGTTLYVTGDVAPAPGANSDFLTVAYDSATGGEIWTARYDGEGGNESVADVVVSPDGQTVIVTGTGDFGTDDFTTIAYDALSGITLWTRHWDGLNASDDSPQAIDIAPDGRRVFVTGSSHSFHEYATVAYDLLSGAELWAVEYTEDGIGDGAHDVVVAPNNRLVVVTGESRDSGTGSDFATIAYDSKTGDQVWVSRYSRPAALLEHAAFIAVDHLGTRIFVAGNSDGDFVLLAYRIRTGTLAWESVRDLPLTHNSLTDMALSQQGEIFVTGWVDTVDHETDYLTIATNASTGAELWSATYDGPLDSYDVPSALGIRPDGRVVFVTGTSAGSDGQSDYATVAYRASEGQRLGALRYDRNDAQSTAEDIAVTDDSAYVTGQVSAIETLLDYGTLAYTLPTSAYAVHQQQR
jgi:PQQ-like domain